MSDATTSAAAVQTVVQSHPGQSVLDALLDAQANTPEPEEELEQEEEPDPGQEERALNALLRKAESAFTKGNKGLLMSRVECGKWCQAIYALRLEQNHKDRGFTSQLIFNRLAIHADSKRECDGSELAKMYSTVGLLAVGAEWKALTLGKLAVLSKLVVRTDGTEEYTLFDADKAEECKALFAWACGDGLKRPSLEDITSRQLELTDPTKYAEKQAAKAAKGEGASADAEDTDAEEDTEEPEAPDNLIATEPAETRPTPPDWKDVPDGMAALFQEGCKQQPGHSFDMMRDFAKQFVWTRAMVKGLLAGIADSKDGKAAEQALQDMVDEIAEEYSIFPAAELQEAA